MERQRIGLYLGCTMVTDVHFSHFQNIQLYSSTKCFGLMCNMYGNKDEFIQMW